jgi:[acyl-carrier-protein] S-malonyltransferase
MKAIRDAVGPDVLLRVDANQGWGAKQAVSIISAMEAECLDIELVEQPTVADDFEGLKYVTDHVRTPILADESVFSVRDAIELIKNRAMCMEKAAVKNGGKMAAVMSADVALIESVCEEITKGGDYVTPVNYNSKQQTVIAGSENGIAKAAEKLTASGVKRVIPLAVAAAFHSEFMKEAAEEFKGLISSVEFKVPEKKFYSNVTGGLLTDFSGIHDILSRHICSPVRFTSELAAMQADGFDNFVECGPGKTLVGLVKKTLDDVTASAIDA